MHIVSVVRLAALVGAGLVVLGGCSRKLTLDEETVERALDRIDTSWPMCASAAVGTARASTSGYRSSGSCGGSLLSESEHANGDTDWVITLDGFCLDTDDGQIVVDGVIEAVQDGRPTDFGPELSALELRTDGPLEMDNDGRTVEIDVAKIRTEYGYPGVTPGTPDAANPDVTTITEISWTHVDDGGRTDFIRDVRVERVGGDVATVDIIRGQTGTRGEGFVDMATTESITVDVPNLDVSGGLLELSGAGGTVATVQLDSARPGVYVLTLDGTEYPREVDCSSAQGPLVQAMVAFLVEAPLF